MPPFQTIPHFDNLNPTPSNPFIPPQSHLLPTIPVSLLHPIFRSSQFHHPFSTHHYTTPLPRPTYSFSQCGFVYCNCVALCLLFLFFSPDVLCVRSLAFITALPGIFFGLGIIHFISLFSLSSFTVWVGACVYSVVVWTRP